jgi:hypothetical protein
MRTRRMYWRWVLRPTPQRGSAVGLPTHLALNGVEVLIYSRSIISRKTSNTQTYEFHNKPVIIPEVLPNANLTFTKTV